MKKTTLIKSTYLETYQKRLPLPLVKNLNQIKAIPLRNEAFDYYFSSAAVYSAMIEGNTLDYKEYFESSITGMNTDNKSYMEITDLIAAYQFADSNELTLKNFMQSHEILSKVLIPDARFRGKIRHRPITVFGGGEKQYKPAPETIIQDEMRKLFEDIEILLKRNMAISEVFYFASMIHLVMLKIVPFFDGNGRTGRLLEKWFLARKLGKYAWFIQSEKLYQSRHSSFYKNTFVGEDYTKLNYKLSLPFLLMLPVSLKMSASF
jgi:Fic family protein